MGIFNLFGGSTVTIVRAGDKKVNVIKVVRMATGWGLKETKEFVDNCPSSFDRMDKKSAEQLASQLVSAGADVKVR